jgi:uncharacterized protein (DUF2141 family)
MNESISNASLKSEQDDLSTPASPEKLLPCCTAGFMPAVWRSGDTKSPGWQILAVVHWLQRKLDQLLSQLRRLSITRGRSFRWRRLFRQLIQAGTALLMVVAVIPQVAAATTPQHTETTAPLSLNPLNPAYATNTPAQQNSSTNPSQMAPQKIFGVQRTQLGISLSTLNPFAGVDVGYLSKPSFADLDNDGVLDAFIGESDGLISYFKNTGTAINPAFVQPTGTLNPFNGVNVGNRSAPSFADLDGDGDLDAFSGNSVGTIIYFQNTGSATSPAFILRTGSLNPFNGVNVGSWSSPNFADIDTDGDLDAFIGVGGGTIHYFQNIGSATSPAFVEIIGTLNPFNGVDVGDFSTPSFADLDNDGDLDAFIGESDGLISYFKNTGTAIDPAFVQRTGSFNPFNGVDVGTYSALSFADLDGDGDLDVFIGEFYGTIQYVENTRLVSSHVFLEHTGSLNPFNSILFWNNISPTFADLDGDGDLDAFIGERFGAIKYFQNTGSATNPSFVEVIGTLNPFNLKNVGERSAPSFADLDGDGDLDAFIGEADGIINYFQNTGSANSPAFIQRTGTFNPFNTVDIGYVSSPTFADLDGDGDLDAFSGELDGHILYFRNSGSATIPAFVQTTSSLNPFDGVAVGMYSTPRFADLDGDGDLDAFIGEMDGNINFFQNTGSATSPAFVQRTGSLNPFRGVDVGSFSVPSFADLDGDGDLDAFIGEYDENINYFENLSLSNKLNLPLVLR